MVVEPSRTEHSTMSKSKQLIWLAETVRLTAFTAAQPDLADLSGSWKTLVEDEPDAVSVIYYI